MINHDRTNINNIDGLTIVDSNVVKYKDSERGYIHYYSFSSAEVSDNNLFIKFFGEKDGYKIISIHLIIEIYPKLKNIKKDIA